MKTELQEAFVAIEKHSADPEVRAALRVEIGTCAAHQGDVYIHRVKDDFPHGVEAGTRQVALGTGNGARHVAEGDLEVFTGTTLPDYVEAPSGVDLTGPVIVAKKTWTLTHPEHAHHTLPPGTFAVTYQYDPRTMKRVVD